MRLKEAEYLRHEILDRLSLCIDFVDITLFTHNSLAPDNMAFTPAQRKRLKHLINLAQKRLCDAYQFVGEIHLED